MQKSSVLGLLLVIAPAAAVLAPGCSLDVGDQVCTQKSDPLDPDDDCPYGPPGGPKVLPAPNTDLCPDPVFADSPACATAWESVFAMMIDTQRGKCSNTPGNCHGVAPGAKGFYFPADDPAKAYENMGLYLNGNGEPYAKRDDATSWVVCNVTAAPGSAAMPPKSGLFEEADKAIVRTWASCRFPGPGDTGAAASSSASGGGGSGGQGGGL